MTNFLVQIKDAKLSFDRFVDISPKVEEARKQKEALTQLLDEVRESLPLILLSIIERERIARENNFQFISAFTPERVAAAKSLDGMWHFVDKKGKILNPWPFSKYLGYSEGVFCVYGKMPSYKPDGIDDSIPDYTETYCLIEGNNLDVIECEETPVSYHDGISVRKSYDDRGYYYMDREGQPLLDYKCFEYAGDFHDGMACVRQDYGRYSLIDTSGAVIHGNLSRFAEYSEGKINFTYFEDDDSLDIVMMEPWHYAFFADINGNRIDGGTRPSTRYGQPIEKEKNDFAEAKPFHDGRAWVRQEEAGDWTLIDHNFDQVDDIYYEEVDDFKDGFALVKNPRLVDASEIFLINTDGKELVKLESSQEFEIIDHVAHIFGSTSNGDSDYYINRNGKRVFDF